MAQPPAYVPPEQQNTAYPPQGSYPQPSAYPQGQPAPYPQGQPVAYPQGQPAPYPQGQPVAYPQGQPVAYPQGQPAPYPQGQPVAYPQGQQVVYAQGQPGVAYPNQQVIVTQGQPTHVYHTGTAQGGCCGSGISEHYNARAGLGTGVTHLVVGVLAIILGGIAYTFPVLQVGYGIWSAIIFYIPTGILGVMSKNKSSCVVVAYMVMSILTSLHALGMLAYEATVAAVLTYVSSCYYQYIGYSSTYLCDYDRSVGAMFIHTLLAILGLVEFINAIVSAAYCCNGHACCCAPASTNQGAVTTTTTTVYGQPQAQPMTVVAGAYTRQDQRTNHYRCLQSMTS